MTAKVKQDARLAACLASTNVAQFAKAFGKDGKAVRATLRAKFGVHVSKGDAFDDATKAALYAYLDGDSDAVTTWRDARTSA